MSVSVEVFNAGDARGETFTFSELPRVGEHLAFHDPSDPGPVPTDGSSKVLTVVHQVNLATRTVESVRIIITRI